MAVLRVATDASGDCACCRPSQEVIRKDSSNAPAIRMEDFINVCAQSDKETAGRQGSSVTFGVLTVMPD
ncbi:hypothetical protein PQQ63_15820 [Paraburkholderia metrosideri]|uniref:Uncharacterized protein n=1 Tax=Paraburkholderia metrosideri TaxID=580937 RepID=A0ABW9DSU0_9BURK